MIDNYSPKILHQRGRNQEFALPILNETSEARAS